MCEEEEHYEMPAGMELNLFMDWCYTVFGWENYKPTVEDWQHVRNNFYSGKSPDSAVQEILRRNKQ